MAHLPVCSFQVPAAGKVPAWSATARASVSNRHGPDRRNIWPRGALYSVIFRKLIPEGSAEAYAFAIVCVAVAAVVRWVAGFWFWQL
jgi:hypothetical protein